MAETAFQKQYRQEFIAGFEQNQSLLRDCCTTEAVMKGNEAEFLVADSGGATAVTRGVNGMIPARGDDLTQTTTTLVEWHDLVRKTRFNVFASQGDQRAIMQRTTMGVINRKIDSDILTELDTTTVTTGSATTMDLSLALKAKTLLGNAEVPFDGQIHAVISPAAEAYLLQVAEFGNADYVTKRPLDSGESAWSDSPGYYRWLGINWIVHPKVPGVGTSSEKCFMFHRSAVGHAMNMDGMNMVVGYEEEQDYSYARCSIFMGTEILQTAGVVEILHDGSALSA
jgi:hypothetical protein